ncbi:MAG: O-antigen ligase family protein [Kineosporiaceae bacterium]
MSHDVDGVPGAEPRSRAGIDEEYAVQPRGSRGFDPPTTTLQRVGATLLDTGFFRAIEDPVDRVAPVSARGRGRSRVSFGLIGAVWVWALIALLAAIATGMLSAAGAGWPVVAIPVGGVLGLALVLLGIVRFEWFVLLILAVRTSLDATKGAITHSGGGEAVTSGAAATAMAALFIGVSLVWLATQWWAGRFARLTALDIALLLFMIAGIASTFGAVEPTSTLVENARVLAAVLMSLVLHRVIVDDAGVRRVIITCYIALITPMTVGLLQAAVGGGSFVTAGLSRVVGTFLHPNTFGFFLSIFLLMGMALFPHVSGRARWALALVALPAGVMVMLTYSRGAWVALIAGVVVVGLVQSAKMLFGVLAGFVVVIAAIPSVWGRVANLEQGEQAGGGTGNSLAWRLQYWRDVVDLNHNNPVTGVGLKGTKELTDAGKAPHNDYLRAWTETGMLGLVAYLCVLVALIMIARRSLQATDLTIPGRVRDRWSGLRRGVAVGYAGVVTAYVIDSIGANLLSQSVVLWYVYALAACATAVIRTSAVANNAADDPTWPLTGSTRGRRSRTA